MWCAGAVTTMARRSRLPWTDGRAGGRHSCAGLLRGSLPHSVPPEHPYLALTGAGRGTEPGSEAVDESSGLSVVAGEGVRDVTISRVTQQERITLIDGKTI